MQRHISSPLALIAIFLLLASKASAVFTFTVENQTSYPLGEVTLHHTIGSSALNVLLTGTYVKEVSTDVAAVTINGHTVTRPNVGYVPIAQGDTIVVGWSDNRVSVVDPTQNW